MQCQELELAAYDFREMGFERFSDPRMQFPSRPAQQRTVSGILHERMLEHVLSSGWHSALIGETGIDELLERLLKPFFSEFADCCCQLERKFAADRSTNLGNSFDRWAEPVEACHQRGL
jgi:hypothetical protein